MLQLDRLASALPFLFLLSGLAAPARAADGQPTNVRVTIEIGRLGEDRGHGPTTYEVVTTIGGSADLSTGMRIPLPAGPGKDAETFTYHQVGLMTRLAVVEVDDDRLMLKGKLEATVIADSTRVPPVTGNLSHDVEVVVTDGDPLRVLHVRTADGGTVYVDLRAARLD